MSTAASMELTPENKHASASTARLGARPAAISCQLPSDPINKCWLILGVQLKIHQLPTKAKAKTRQNNKKTSCDFLKDLIQQSKKFCWLMISQQKALGVVIKVFFWGAGGRKKLPGCPIEFAGLVSDGLCLKTSLAFPEGELTTSREVTLGKLKHGPFGWLLQKVSLAIGKGSFRRTQEWKPVVST